MAEIGVPVDDATRQRWAELALRIRTDEWLISTVSQPEPGTAFYDVDHWYLREAISQWSREGIRSAVDHLSVWADITVPIEQREGQIVRGHGFRWYFTLMRAGLEGAAQSLWLSSSKSGPEALARLVRMVRHDLDEQAKAWQAMGRDTAPIFERIKGHEAAASALVEHGADTGRLPSMVDLVRYAAVVLKRDPDLFEGHWRVCSAAAHGKDWAIQELQTVVGDPVEWMPGQFHFVGHVDPKRLTEMLSDTTDFVGGAVVMYLQRTYADALDQLLRRGAFEAAKMTPQRDGGKYIDQIAKEWGLIAEDDNSTVQSPEEPPPNEGSEV